MIVAVSTTFVRHGKGTPIPTDPPGRLVIVGLFHYVRNPMYEGALLVLVAETAYFRYLGLLLYAAGLWAALHTFLVLVEEPQLRKRFGADYEQYLRRVPRWIPCGPWRAIANGRFAQLLAPPTAQVASTVGGSESLRVLAMLFPSSLLRLHLRTLAGEASGLAPSGVQSIIVA
jgi:Phospholipid methyltransferase